AVCTQTLQAAAAACQSHEPRSRLHGRIKSANDQLIPVAILPASSLTAASTPIASLLAASGLNYLPLTSCLYALPRRPPLPACSTWIMREGVTVCGQSDCSAWQRSLSAASAAAEGHADLPPAAQSNMLTAAGPTPAVCMDCKQLPRSASTSGNEERMMFCDACDRGFHTILLCSWRGCRNIPAGSLGVPRLRWPFAGWRKNPPLLPHLPTPRANTLSTNPTTAAAASTIRLRRRRRTKKPRGGRQKESRRLLPAAALWSCPLLAEVFMSGLAPFDGDRRRHQRNPLVGGSGAMSSEPQQAAAKPIEDVLDDEDKLEDETVAERILALAENVPKTECAHNLAWVATTTGLIALLAAHHRTRTVGVEEAELENERKMMLGPASASAAGSRLLLTLRMGRKTPSGHDGTANCRIGTGALSWCSCRISARAERQSATDTVMEFRRAARPYDLCRRLLAASANPLLMFEAASTMRHALLREWRDPPACRCRGAAQGVAAAPAGRKAARTAGLRAGAGGMGRVGCCWPCASAMAKLCRHAHRMVERWRQLLLPQLDRAAQLLGCAGLRALLNEIPVGQLPGAPGSTSSRRRQFEGGRPVRAFVLCVRLLPLPRASATTLRGLPAAGGPELTGFANVFAQPVPAQAAAVAARWTGCRLHWLAKLPSSPSEPWKLPPPPRELLTQRQRRGVEAADSLLDAWAHLFAADSSGGPFDSGSAADLASAASSTEASAASTVGPIAQTLFAALMRSRAWRRPDGFRGLAAMQQRQATEADDDESVHELRRRTRFDSLPLWPLLANLRAGRRAFALSALAEALDQARRTAGWSSAAWGVRCRRLDAHWLLLVVGHVIVEPDAEEAAPFVPRSLMSESLAQSANVAESVRALCEACQGQGRAGGGHSQQVDRLLQLVAAVLTDIAWLLSRLSRVYFGLDETLYDTISPAILAAFGQDSGESLRCCAQFAVDYCRVCLARWPVLRQLRHSSSPHLQAELSLLSGGQPAQLVAAGPGYRRALTPPLTDSGAPAALSTAVRAVVQAGRALSTAADQPAKDGRHSDAVERERTYWGVTVVRLQLRAGELISSGLPDSSTRPLSPSPSTLWPAVAMPLSLNRLCCHWLKLPPICQPWLPTPPRCCWDRWCASLLPASPPPLRLLAY
uniref:SET domain-containing protein n=1 Tax=Macrostomum lignano TaxID=282301 RepID=A0A1I8FEM7_9PLAT